MDKQILILTTTRDFLGKFETGNVKILKEMGYSVHYAANMEDQRDLFYEKDMEELGIYVHHIDIERSPYMARNNKRAFHQLTEIVRKYRISVVHCHTPVGGVLGRLLGRYFAGDGVKIIYTAHGFHFYKGAPLINNSVYYCAERLLAHYTDILVVINEEDYTSATRFRLRKGGRVYRVPGVGLDTDRYHIFTDEERLRGRKALGIKEDQLFIVSLGEINENKNQIAVLRALAFMRESGQDISGVVYGICGDGFFREYIEKQIRNMRLEDQAKVFGYRRDVQEILGCADASVFPSKREGLGMAALESLAMGVPVIASDNRGTREYMKDGQNGYVCGAQDIKGFAGGINKIWFMNEDEKKKMKVRCRETAERFEKRYTEKIMREVYITADKMAVEAKRHGKTG